MTSRLIFFSPISASPPVTDPRNPTLRPALQSATGYAGQLFGLETFLLHGTPT